MTSFKLRLPEAMRSKIKKICDSLGITEAEYIRGALAAKLRRDMRQEGQSE